MHEQPYALTICILRLWGALAESGVFHFAGGKQRWAIQQRFAFISMFQHTPSPFHTGLLL